MVSLPNKHPETGALRNVWKAFNNLRDYTMSLRPAKGRGIRHRHTSHGVVSSVKSSKVAALDSSLAKQFKVTAISNDTITCRAWDGTNNGETDIVVAKPYRLRKTPWDGVTVSYDFNGTIYSIAYSYLTTSGFRTAQVTVGTTQTTESQAIIPIYKVGEIIYATEPDGGTDLASVSWLDLNVDARAWACY